MEMPSFLVPLGARFFTRSRSVLSFWARHARVATFPDVPWVPLDRPVRELTVAMVTTAGVHLRTDLPFDMSDRAGDPSFREIPSGAHGPDLMVTHDYYDHRDADRDVNVVFPVDRLREMEKDGEIGGLAPVFYSFMGHVGEPHLPELRERTSREVARRLAAAGAGLVLLSGA
jgi:D-proline reductase (dithiol) PrdB